MKNILAEDFNREQEIKAAYKAAQTEEEKQQAGTAYHNFQESITAKGNEYATVYRFYSEAKERGNEYIDISDCHEYRDEKKLIDMLRECGIEKFTFSSSWSSAVDSAWIFIQNGCKLEGMLEINSGIRDFFEGGYEKAHGYLFSIG